MKLIESLKQAGYFSEEEAATPGMLKKAGAFIGKTWKDGAKGKAKVIGAGVGAAAAAAGAGYGLKKLIAKKKAEKAAKAKTEGIVLEKKETTSDKVVKAAPKAAVIAGGSVLGAYGAKKALDAAKNSETLKAGKKDLKSILARIKASAGKSSVAKGAKKVLKYSGKKLKVAGKFLGKHQKPILAGAAGLTALGAAKMAYDKKKEKSEGVSDLFMKGTGAARRIGVKRSLATLGVAGLAAGTAKNALGLKSQDQKDKEMKMKQSHQVKMAKIKAK